LVEENTRPDASFGSAKWFVAYDRGVVASRQRLSAPGVLGDDVQTPIMKLADHTGLVCSPAEELKADPEVIGRLGKARSAFEHLKRTRCVGQLSLQTGRHAAAILADRALRARLVCTRGCCIHRGFEDLADRRRQHYLWARDAEVEEVRARPTADMRRDLVHERLRDARDAARHVRRVLGAQRPDLPSFDQLDRWIGVLARDARVPRIA
jgi:hypothetical protein